MVVVTVEPSPESSVDFCHGTVAIMMIAVIKIVIKMHTPIWKCRKKGCGMNASKV